MREDLLEKVEREFPNGFMLVYLDGNQNVRVDMVNQEKSDFIVAAYHQILSMAMMFKPKEK